MGANVVQLRKSRGLTQQQASEVSGVPRPTWATLESGTFLFRELAAGALAVAGTWRQNEGAGASDVLSRPDTIFAIFHRELSRGNVVSIYGLNYKDTRTDALRWLRTLGDPYAASAFDQDGRVGIDWGV